MFSLSPLGALGFNRLIIYCLITLYSMNSHEGGFLSVGKVVKLLKIKSSLELLLLLTTNEHKQKLRIINDFLGCETHLNTEPWLCATCRHFCISSIQRHFI